MSLRSASQQPPVIVYMSNAIGSSRESNPLRRICHLRAAPLGHVADKQTSKQNCLGRKQNCLGLYCVKNIFVNCLRQKSDETSCDSKSD